MAYKSIFDAIEAKHAEERKAKWQDGAGQREKDRVEWERRYSKDRLSMLNLAMLSYTSDLLTLGLSANETSETAIKAAYRKLAAKYHPDKPTGDHNQFIKIRKAYESLSARG